MHVPSHGGGALHVLVTGANGFLGAHVVARLLAHGHTVRAMVREGRARAHVEASGVELVAADLLDESSLRRACRGADGMVHCAARMGFWSRQNEVQRWTIVEGSSALYRAAHAAQMERMVHVSSIAAVGATRDPRPLDDDAPWTGRALRVHYVDCKREAEERVLSAARRGMPIAVVNPTMLAGPRLDGRPPSYLVRRIALRRARWVPRGGTSVADVEDVAEGIVLALERARPGQRYVLGGHDLAWRELYDAVARELGAPQRFRTIPAGAARSLAVGAALLDVLRLSRPPWTPEILRSWGWYTFARSDKAVRELGYRIRPLDEVIRRMCAGASDVLRASATI